MGMQNSIVQETILMTAGIDSLIAGLAVRLIAGLAAGLIARFDSLIRG